MKATAATTIRWLRMTSVKNCHKLNNCKCADSLRKNILRIPDNYYHEIKIEKDINIIQKKYDKCFGTRI
jgi:hypothetical protein